MANRGRFGRRAGEGEIEIPASVLSSGDLFIRLTGEGPSCNLQVSGYELEAALKETPGRGCSRKDPFPGEPADLP